jgi:uncharacterized protein YqeY
MGGRDARLHRLSRAIVHCSLYNMQARSRSEAEVEQRRGSRSSAIEGRMEAVLKQRIQDELKAAMRGGDETRKTVLRLLVAQIKNAEVEARTDGRGGVLSDSDVLALVRREIKQHEESLLEAQNAGREDLVAQQQAELDVLKEFLPKQLSREEIIALAKQTIQELNATSPKQHGQVMKALQPKVKDIADGKLVNEVVRELLG